MFIRNILKTNESFKDEKTPIVIIGTTTRENYHDRNSIDYKKVRGDNNYFLYVMPTIKLPEWLSKKIQYDIPFCGTEDSTFRHIFAPILDNVDNINTINNILND